jgi:hypothetical protein
MVATGGAAVAESGSGRFSWCFSSSICSGCFGGKMPFKSRSQERAAFGGYLGPEMKRKAKQWADETPSQSALPDHVRSKKAYDNPKHVSDNPAKSGDTVSITWE